MLPNRRTSSVAVRTDSERFAKMGDERFHAKSPNMVGEFVDTKGQRYVMVVNNSMTDSVSVCITFPGQDARVFSWNWSGQEREGPAYCGSAPSRDKNGLTIGHWLAPGQEAVYRVQSASAAKEPIRSELP